MQSPQERPEPEVIFLDVEQGNDLLASCEEVLSQVRPRKPPASGNERSHRLLSGLPGPRTAQPGQVFIHHHPHQLVKADRGLPA